MGKPKYKYNHKAASANYLRQLNTGLFIGMSNKMSSIVNGTPYVYIVALKIIAMITTINIQRKVTFFWIINDVPFITLLRARL